MVGLGKGLHPASTRARDKEPGSHTCNCIEEAGGNLSSTVGAFTFFPSPPTRAWAHWAGNSQQMEALSVPISLSRMAPPPPQHHRISVPEGGQR